jgi:hypothetical protein
MKLTSLAILFFTVILFAACSSKGGKKLVVWSSGKINVDAQDNKTINLDPGNQHNELELTYPGADKVTVTVKTNGGSKATYDMTDNGVYVLNLKSDTVVGSLVNYGAAGRPASISGVQLQHMIDSTQDLLVGKNASDDKKTYWIVPNSIKKVSPNEDAKTLSPYKLIPYQVELDQDGKAPETYKFFTNAQKREDLNDLLKRLAK